MPATQIPHRAQTKLAGCRVFSQHLIEVRSTEQAMNRELNEGIRDARDWGATIDMLSEATGYSPKQIRSICGEAD